MVCFSDLGLDPIPFFFLVGLIIFQVGQLQLTGSENLLKNRNLVIAEIHKLGEKH